MPRILAQKLAVFLKCGNTTTINNSKSPHVSVHAFQTPEESLDIFHVPCKPSRRGSKKYIIYHNTLTSLISSLGILLQLACFASSSFA